MKKRLAITLALSLLGATSIVQAKDAYIWELTNSAPYQAVWTKTVWNNVADKSDNAWLRAGGNSTATALVDTSVGGVKYRAGFMCEPHNCGVNYAHVLINPNRIVAMHVNGDNRVFYGAPTQTEIDYLLDDANFE